MTKTCSQCKSDKPFSEFYKNSEGKFGLLAACRVCAAEKSKRYREKNGDEVRSRQRAKFQNDPTARAEKNARTIAWRERMRAEGKMDEIALRHRCNQYNISVDRYHSMYAAQEGRCAGCGAVADLQIDHDHGCCPEDSRSCGKCVRGLLCGPCNTFLGRLEDSRERLDALLKYKEHFQSVQTEQSTRCNN